MLAKAIKEEKIDMFIHDMHERFGGQFTEHESLAKHVNIRIGGPVRYFVEAKNAQDIIDAVQLAKQYEVPYFILGGGSNTIASDEGWNGLVIKVANRELKIEGTKVIAEAGVISALVARKTAEAGLKGFTWAISLPGTIGGAVRGNAGCFGGEMKDSVVSVRVLRDGEVMDIPATELHFSYRHSIFKDPAHTGDVILSATLKLENGDAVEEKALLDSYLSSRKASQPLGSSSAGCMFKNFEFTDETDIRQIEADAQIPALMLANHRIAAGWIIEQLGLKGLQVGDAQVSEVHGNFLLNKGHATAKDIAELISRIKSRARDVYGVQLQEEVQFLGL